ncbi:MAG TPA: hypothetical protein VJX74_02885 [Blastocatellia bacterium]|nr:hypothetical protein [Blastocatellia bacterium]
MKRLILLSAILFLASIPAKAQSSYPSTEIFGGYSYASTELITRRNTNGFGASFAGNLSENWGFVGEISGHYGKDVFNFPIIGDVEVKFNKYLFLGGPRYSKRGNAATGFAHVLVGGARLNVEGQDNGSGLAVAVGGGVDVNAGKNFAIRAFQVDYIPERSLGRWTQTFRAQFGIVLKFGQ